MAPKKKNIIAIPQGIAKAEAQRLQELANSRMGRGKWEVALRWEMLRYLYHAGELPEFWRRMADKLPLSEDAGGGSDFREIMQSPNFPGKSWAEVDSQEQSFLGKHLRGEPDKAVRALEIQEAWRKIGFLARETLKAARRAKCGKDSGRIEQLAFPGTGEMVSWILVEVRWEHKDNKLKTHFGDVLKKLRGSRTPNDMGGKPSLAYSKKFKGLASLWLSSAHVPDKEQANDIYPRSESSAPESQKKGAKTDKLAPAREEASRFKRGLVRELNRLAMPLLEDLAERHTPEHLKKFRKVFPLAS